MAEDEVKVKQPGDAADNSKGPGGGNFNPRILQTLQMGGLLLVPATFFGIICKLAGLTDRVIAEVSITVFLLSTVLVFASFIKRRLNVALAAGISVILAAVLIHLLLTPARETPPEDPWVTWERQIRDKVEQCKSEDKTSEICIAQAISQKYPEPKSAMSTELLDNDLRAGTILMNIGAVKDLLNTRVGIKDHFLGNGFAQPDEKEKHYSHALVPEYLAANLGEADGDVWTWELAPVGGQLNRNLADIIGSRKDTIKEIEGRDDESFNGFSKNVRERLAINHKAPAVIRFARFAREKFSHKMGLPNAKRVFVLHLGSVYNLKLGDAAKLSGYSLENQKTDHDKLWIWVYLPGDERDIVRPAWGEISANLKNWLVE